MRTHFQWGTVTCPKIPFTQKAIIWSRVPCISSKNLSRAQQSLSPTPDCWLHPEKTPQHFYKHKYPLLWTIENSQYCIILDHILDTYKMCVLQIFSPVYDLIFYFLNSVFWRVVFHLKYNLSTFFFVLSIFVFYLRNLCQIPRSQIFFLLEILQF